MAVFRLTRARIAFLHDVVMAAIAFPVSLYLRLGDEALDYPGDELLLWTALFTAVAAAVFASMRLYRGVWRYASLADMVAIAKAVTLASLIFLPLMFLLTRLQGLPRSLIVINGFVLIGALGGPRILYRILKDRSVNAVLSRDGHRRVPVLLIGAGDGAELFIRATHQRPAAAYGVVGIIDDKGTRIGRNIHGVDVIAGLDDIGAVVDRLSQRGRQPERIVIASDALAGSKIRELLDFADARGMTLSRLPKLTDFRDGMRDDLHVQPIAIEDLLGRPQTVLDRDGMRALITGKRALVTGAGGTIGSELVRQIADFEPSHLCLLDYGEYNLYAIDLEIGERWPALSRSAILCDVRDQARVARVMAAEAPNLVFHAAALKHVPVVEAHPHEGVLTNVIGTRNVADAGRAAGVNAVVLISTDKAVNPTNVMGATKRIAESYCQALDISEMTRGGRTRFFTVRFGNVLGSTGSVVPLFQRQLAAGGPLTVTHPDVTRYFMTTREAVELVLQATVLGLDDDADHGKIFVLDMGEPVRIADLAKQMIRLSGLQPGIDIKIDFVGLRPGEKLREELFHAAEQTVPTARGGILLAAPRTVDYAFLARAIEELADAASSGRMIQMIAILRHLVPEARLDDRSEDLVAAERLGS
jgi:O-antigen biosynthesis protein WbqV